mgnify:CR=1 FL=1
MHTPEISIIIPVLNSPLVAETLAALRQQQFALDKVEIFVVGLVERHIIQTDDKVQFIETSVTVSEARNIGIQASSGKWLVFLDSDCIPIRQWLGWLVTRLGEGWPVVGGGVAIDGGSFYATCYNIATFHEFLDILPPGFRNYLPTLNLAVRREVAMNVGIMDESLPRAEDIDWTVRMKSQGYPLYFEPRATVYHRPETHLRRILTKWINTGYCSRIVRQRHPTQLQAPLILNSPEGLLALAPAIALVASMRIYRRNPVLLRWFYTWPVVFLTRVAWCLGAAAGVRDGYLRKVLFPTGELNT